MQLKNGQEPASALNLLVLFVFFLMHLHLLKCGEAASLFTAELPASGVLEERHIGKTSWMGVPCAYLVVALELPNHQRLSGHGVQANDLNRVSKTGMMP